MSFCGFSVYGTFSWFSDAAMASLVMAQTLVMMSVFCRSRHSLVMPRKILQIGEPGRTVEQFFHDVAWAKIREKKVRISVEARRALMKSNCQYNWTCYLWRISPICDLSTRTKRTEAVNAFAKP